ncbi:MAG: response regulator [Deltaproteobacteria bacterium]|nr:response regulator [Deltaproteobacteria bacterium]
MSHRVLLVDDSPTMRSFVATTLEADGYDVTQVQGGFQALKVLPNGHFDLVITDINMPDINGLELIKFLRSNPAYQNTPVFIISTEGRERDRDRGLGLGANAYLVKPFKPEQLLAVVRNCLGGSGGSEPGK